MALSNEKKYLKLVKSIEESNAQFKAATKAEKIAIIANDVLQLLVLRRLRVVHGRYVDMKLPRSFKKQVMKEEEKDFVPQFTSKPFEISKVLKMPDMPRCDVCAIGSVMVASTIRLNNVEQCDTDIANLSYEDDGDPGTMSGNAQKIFPPKLLRAMECAFEQGKYGYGKTRRGEERLKTIYQNLLGNKGEKFTAFADGFFMAPSAAVKQGQTIFDVKRGKCFDPWINEEIR
jgi:hypothetical protein